jgi:hypothetical protein
VSRQLRSAGSLIAREVMYGGLLNITFLRTGTKISRSIYSSDSLFRSPISLGATLGPFLCMYNIRGMKWRGGYGNTRDGRAGLDEMMPGSSTMPWRSQFPAKFAEDMCATTQTRDVHGGMARFCGSNPKDSQPPKSYVRRVLRNVHTPRPEDTSCHFNIALRTPCRL